MSAPTVTVLLPVFNGGALLRESLDSILAQTWRDFELLVIDDGSTDGTAALLRAEPDPRLRVLTNDGNLGLIRSLNRGLDEARGEFVARQDADDVSAPARLARQLEFLRAAPGVQLLGTGSWRIDPAGRRLGARDVATSAVAIRWESLVDNPFIHTSVIFRRRVVIEEFNGYDEAFPAAEDYELWNRIAARHPVANLGARLVHFREHAGSVSRTQADTMSATVRKILAANCAAVFPGRQFSGEELRLLASFRLRFPAEELPRLRRLLDELLARFLATHPEARGSADLRATLCRQALRLGYKFLIADRRVAVAEIARAFRLSPAEWLRQGCATGRAEFMHRLRWLRSRSFCD